MKARSSLVPLPRACTLNGTVGEPTLVHTKLPALAWSVVQSNTNDLGLYPPIKTVTSFSTSHFTLDSR